MFSSAFSQSFLAMNVGMNVQLLVKIMRALDDRIYEMISITER